MFTLNFGGSISARELRVSDTEPLPAVAHTLHFGTREGSSMTTRVQTVPAAEADAICHGWPTDSDTSDAEWLGEYEDFEGIAHSSTSSPSSS
jgi:hypothetical protein